MGFLDTSAKFLGLSTKKEVEELQEKIETQNLLLDSVNDEAASKTAPSSLARETRQVKDFEGLVVRRVPTKELQLLYLNNQFVFRGVNVRADELITRGYKIVEGDEEGRKNCQELIERSGGNNLFWQYSVNTDVAGDGYLEKVKNKSGTKIAYLRHVNPINFGFLSEKNNFEKIILGSDGKPKAYEQVLIDNEGKELRKEVSKDVISHLRFNTFGDEFNGISSLQPVYNTSVRLMNMEQAAAEAAVKTANPTWVVMTSSKAANDLNKWAQALGRISAKEVVFLPDGVTTELKSPGNQNFSAYADYFLDAVVAALGVPKSILTGGSDSSGGNRATVQTLSKHFYSVIRANQRYVEEIFNAVFQEYAKMAGFAPPKLVFNDIAEDADRNGQRALELYAGGVITLEEARQSIGLDTPQKLKDELERTGGQQTGNIDPDKEGKAQDAKVFHPAAPGSPEGSQKNEKKAKKLDPTVPSAR